MSRITIRNHAPYAYLKKKTGTSDFYLYVLIPVEGGKAIECEPSDCSSGLSGNDTTVKFRVTSPGGTPFHYFAKRIEVSPQTSEADCSVLVFVRQEDNSDFETNIVYEDKDIVDHPDDNSTYAYDAPYVYLTQPPVDNDPNPPLYPFMLVLRTPRSVYLDEHIAPIADPAGSGSLIFTAAVNYGDMNTSSYVHLPPVVNSYIFRKSTVGDYFEAIVIKNDAEDAEVRRRKTKIKTINADDKPLDVF